MDQNQATFDNLLEIKELVVEYASDGQVITR